MSDRVPELSTSPWSRWGRGSGLGSILGLALLSTVASGQEVAPPAQPLPPNVQSPVVENGRVTFSVYAPQAGAVKLRSGEISFLLRSKPFVRDHTTGAWNFDRRPFTRGGSGVWTLTLGPLAPGIYDYTFDIDGVVVADPANAQVVSNRRGSIRGLVEIPGPPGQPRHDEWRPVPHGTITAHWYDSKVTGSRRRLHVYTPPGYDPTASKRYPVLYLLHGNSGHDLQWTDIGRANVIADNVIADGKSLPMLIVMPDGHPLRPDPTQRTDEKLKEQLFDGDLLREIIPLVERTYRVVADREHRAIAGLSMGGGQSLGAGFRHNDRFAWIGGFSASLGSMFELIPAKGAAAAAFNERTRLLWIATGNEDYDVGVKRNRDFVERLKEAGVRHVSIESEGMHMWSVWRRYLADFMPLLFRTGRQSASTAGS